MKIDGKIYDTEEISSFQSQDQDETIQPYGWVLEWLSKFDNKMWFSNWTRKIYNSRHSALNAAIQIGWKKTDFRIIPLYKMENKTWREFKINEVLDEKPKKEGTLEIRAWKALKDFDFSQSGLGKGHKKGTIFIQLENGNIIKSGTPKETVQFLWSRNRLLEEFTRKVDTFQEIKLEDEKWLYPHLLKELKIKFEK